MTKELLREITAAVDIPVVAIGGINADNAVTLEGTGIAGIAVVGAILQAQILSCSQGTRRNMRQNSVITV